MITKLQTEKAFVKFDIWIILSIETFIKVIVLFVKILHFNWLSLA